KSNKPAYILFELINFNNTIPIPTNNIAQSIQQSQDFYNHNDYLSSYTSHTISSYNSNNIDPESIYNSDYILLNVSI
ncbi:17945_t:CDS:1, partial [Gigaspora margarita]